MNSERPKSLIGKGHYFNWLALQVLDTGSAFQIAPASTPKKAIGTTATVIALAFISLFAIIAKNISREDRVWGLGLTVILGLATTAAVIFGIRHYYQSEQSKGVVFDNNKQTGVVCLPRLNKCFEKEKIVCFQIVKDFLATEPVAELQLVVQDSGKFQVFCLVQTNNFLLLKPIAEQLRSYLSWNLYVVEHPSDFGKNKINEYLME
jgi:hypothetical protein